MNELNLIAWDANNKTLTREVTKQSEDWETTVGNAPPLSKQERWALRELMTDPEYHKWRQTLTTSEQRRLKSSQCHYHSVEEDPPKTAQERDRFRNRHRHCARPVTDDGHRQPPRCSGASR